MLLEEKSQNQKSYKKKLNSISQKKKTKSNSWPPPRFNLNLTLITLEITCRFSRTQEGRNRARRERERETLLAGVPRRSLLAFISPWFLFCLRNQAGKRGGPPSTTTFHQHNHRRDFQPRKANDYDDDVDGSGSRRPAFSPPGRVSFRFLATDADPASSFPSASSPPPPLSYFFPSLPLLHPEPPSLVHAKEQISFLKS